jgi:hypothetical protein
MALSFLSMLTNLQACLRNRRLMGLIFALAGLAWLEQLSPDLLQISTFALPVALAAAFATPRQVAGLAALALLLGLWAELGHGAGFCLALGLRLLTVVAIAVVALWLAQQRRCALNACEVVERMVAPGLGSEAPVTDLIPMEAGDRAESLSLPSWDSGTGRKATRTAS